MWTAIKYLAIVIAIVFGVKWYFGEHSEQGAKAKYQAALKLFYEEQSRYPVSFEEMEKKNSAATGYPYIAPNTNRDRPPANGKWRVNEDRGVVYIERYQIDDQGRPKKDGDGNLIFKDEY